MGMTRMTVNIKIPVYEIDDKDRTGLGDPHMLIHSHWSRTSDFIVIEIDGHKYTVAKDGLKQAIDRASGF
jgi:hypothetical protein